MGVALGFDDKAKNRIPGAKHGSKEGNGKRFTGGLTLLENTLFHKSRTILLCLQRGAYCAAVNITYLHCLHRCMLPTPHPHHPTAKRKTEWTLPPKTEAFKSEAFFGERAGVCVSDKDTRQAEARSRKEKPGKLLVERY